jgi:GNAT superfamily N-acetyltransferase
MNMRIVLADYANEKHAGDLVALLNHYAVDRMGGGEALDAQVQAQLASALAGLPHAFSLLCYVNDRPAGLANCFEGFSTFRCKPLINIHDLVVDREYRGLGISQRLLERVEEMAKEKGCCKITLEVLEGNETARNAYLKFGFAGYELDPVLGKALFWQKRIG